MAFADDAQDAVAVFFAEVADVEAGRFEDPQAEEAEQADEGEVVRLVESLAAVSIASNCRWLRPRVGDCGGTLGRRTYSAGECSSTPSMTQVR